MVTKFVNAKILSRADAEIIKGELVVDGGKIVFVGKDYLGACDRVIDCHGNVLVPGMINCHAHSPMVLMRGFGDGKELHRWLHEDMFPLEDKWQKEDIYWATLLAVMEYVRGGITTVNDDYFYYDEMAHAFYDAKMRAVVALNLNYTPQKAIKPQKMEEFWNNLTSKFKTNLLSYNYYCHSVYQNDETEFATIASFAKKHHSFVSTHMSETLDEVGTIAKKFNDQTPTKLLESYGFFDQPSLVAHSVYVDDADMDILKRHDASVVINSGSNLKLASGIPPVYALSKRGVNVCLGTDGAASNDKLDMFRELYLASVVQKGYLKEPKIMNSESVLKMAWENGAKALMLQNVGKLEVGYQADIVMLDTSAVLVDENIKPAIVYAMGRENVMLTMVGGNILYEFGEYHIGEKTETVLRHCESIVDRMKERK